MERLLTKDQIHYLEIDRCCDLCGQYMEAHVHSSFTCDYDRRIWAYIRSWGGGGTKGDTFTLNTLTNYRKEDKLRWPTDLLDGYVILSGGSLGDRSLLPWGKYPSEYQLWYACTRRTYIRSWLGITWSVTIVKSDCKGMHKEIHGTFWQTQTKKIDFACIVY